MKGILYAFAFLVTIQFVFGEEVRLLDLDPPEAQQVIDKQDQSLHYAAKVDSNVPAVRFLGNEPHNVLEDIYLARQYHGQDGLGGYLYGYNVPDIAKTEKKKAGGDLRGAYNYIAGDGQEIKVEYWDDGTGFHQIDNVPKILPKQIDDSPEVKAEKEKFLARWHEEAERNMHPVQNPYDSEGQYASGPLSPQGQLQQKQQLYAQQQYQQPNQYQQSSQQYQSGQYQQQPNPYLKSSVTDRYQTGQQPSASPYSQSQSAVKPVNQYNQQPSGQYQQTNQYQQQSTPSGQYHSAGQYQQSSGNPGNQGSQYQPSNQYQSSVTASQYQQSGGNYKQPGHQAGQYQQTSTGQQQQSGGNYQQPGNQAGQYQQSLTGQHQQSGGTYQQSGNQGGQNQNQVDYTGQYSSNQNVYSQANPGTSQSHESSSSNVQYQQTQYSGHNVNEINKSDDSYDGKYDEEEESTGPPKGFFYSFEYPVGIIVSKEGVAKREGNVHDVYNENKAKFEAQIQSGHSAVGSANGYMFVKSK